MITGHSTVGTSPKALDSTGYQSHRYIEVKADADLGEESIYVGSIPNVSPSTGFRLSAGERLRIELASTAQLFVVGSDTDLGYSFLVV